MAPNLKTDRNKYIGLEFYKYRFLKKRSLYAKFNKNAFLQFSVMDLY